MKSQNYANPLKSMSIGVIFILLWCIFTGIDYKAIIKGYATTSLPMALLTIDSIFFGAIIILISILISMAGTNETYKHIRPIIISFRTLSIGIAFLLIANISSYFTSGFIDVIAIYYQIWTIPALMLVFYLVFPHIKNSDENLDE